MSDPKFDQFDPSLEEDRMGPFGTGPVVEDDLSFDDPSLDDQLYEKFGDFDAFGPFRSRYEDYSDPEAEWPYVDLG